MSHLRFTAKAARGVAAQAVTEKVPLNLIEVILAQGSKLTAAPVAQTGTMPPQRSRPATHVEGRLWHIASLFTGQIGLQPASSGRQ
jgi:hypothetical protein